MDLGRVISRFILPSLILATTSLGQQGLNSFAEIKENLEGGRRLQMNAFADRCESTTPTDLSMPLRHWQIVTENGETTVRANDFSVLPGRSELSFIIRELNIFANGTVKVDIIVPVQITETYSVTCVLGRGAFVHRVDFGADVEQLVSYDEIKTGLLLGKHIEAVGTLHKCYNYQEVLGDTELTVGFLVSNIAVLNDGQPNEAMASFENALVSPTLGGPDLVYFSDAFILPRNADLLINSGSFDVSDGFNQNFAANLSCPSDALTFFDHKRAMDDTYLTYEGVKQAVLSGHDLVYVAFPGLCELVSGDPTPADIGMRMFDQYELVPVGSDANESREYISFNFFALDPQGLLVTDAVKVFNDDTTLLEYSTFDLASGSSDRDTDDNRAEYPATGAVSCPLGDASLFHAARGTRVPIGTFAALKFAYDIGMIFEIEVVFSECESSDVNLNTVSGGVVWEMFHETTSDAEAFTGSVSAIANESNGETSSLVWEVLGFSLFSDGTVFVYPRKFDFLSGQELSGGGTVVCVLGNSLPGFGGVRFFRYGN